MSEISYDEVEITDIDDTSSDADFDSDLPDDSGMEIYDSELPDDSGKETYDSELPDDSGKETYDSELPDDSGKETYDSKLPNDSSNETSENNNYMLELNDMLNDYINDLKSNSEFPETISDNLINLDDIKKQPPEITKELRQEFNRDKEKLIAEWEKENNREWPVYKEDVYNEYGELVKRKGWKYDAHHIHPLSMGGKNEANNITPLRYDIHSDHKGVHAFGSPYDNLEKILKEKSADE